MDEPQTIRTQAGEELVVLSRQDYDQLLSALAEAEEELADIATLDQRKSDGGSVANQVLPTEVGRRLLDGQGRLQALREWRGLARTAMAEKLRLDEAALARIEEDRTPLEAAMAARIAVLLDVPADWIAG
jgi:ribosome-binding protein aMBF1 (putative translation factor)